MSKKEVVLKLFADVGNANNRDERKKIRHEIINVCKPVIDNLCRLHIKFQQPSDELEDYGNWLIACERAGRPLPSLKSPVLDEERGKISFVFDEMGLDNVAVLELSMLEDGAEKEVEDLFMEMRINDLEYSIADGEDENKQELDELKKLLQERKGDSK